MLHSSGEEQIIHIINTYILSLGRKEVPEKRGFEWGMGDCNNVLIGATANRDQRFALLS